MVRGLVIACAAATAVASLAIAPAAANHGPLPDGNTADPASNPQVPWGFTPVHDVVFSEDGSLAFASVEYEEAVAVFALPSWDLVELIDVGGPPFGMDRTHDGFLLVGVADSAEIVEIDMATRTIVSRVDLDPLLRYTDLRDVMEVDDGIVLVTNLDPREDPVRYERADPSTAAFIATAGGQYWSISGERGTGFIHLGTNRSTMLRVDTTDPTFPRDGFLDDDEIIDGRWVPSDSGRGRLYSRGGAVISTDSRRVVDNIGHGTPALSADGSEVYQFVIDHLPTESVAALNVYDADTLELLRSFEPSCYGFGVFAAVPTMMVDPSGENLVVLGDEGVCLEPLDGSGATAVLIAFLVDPVDSPQSARARFAVFDAQGRLAFESESREIGAFGLRLLPGDYRVIVYDVVRDDGWPYLSAWHDRTPLLSREIAAPLRIDRDETFELPVDPFFHDIRETSQTFWDAIWWLRLTGITTGCGATTFCPEDFVTRGQMAAFLDRALDLPTGGPSGFVDDAGTFRQNIWNLKAAGITTGCAPDRFCTAGFVTRGQMAAFLDRALDLPTGGPSGFVDDGGTFRQNIWNLKAAGITTGCAPDRFCTGDHVTRAQMALLLERALADYWPGSPEPSTPTRS